MAVNDFYIDIENSSGTKQGPGPITSASGWAYTARMDRSGSFSFDMPASDAMADEVVKKRVVRAYALLDGAWTECGAGIIDNIVKTPQADGKVSLSVSGGSEERELTYRSVGFLELESSGQAISHSAALTDISIYAPKGWTFTPDSSPGVDSVYGRFAGESVLQALVALSEKSQSHFYRSGAKAITFASTFTDSGVRAIRAGGDLTAATCAIVDLSEQIDTYELMTRIFPYGAGQGQARLTLAATSRSAPSGYFLSATNNYIFHIATEETYGKIERYIEYKDVAPVSNTDADLQSAANTLFDVALEELTRRSTELEQATYTVRLAQCEALLRPLQTIRVVYVDPNASMDIDVDLNILEATIAVGANGLRTTGLVVSNADRWPEKDSDIVADEMAQGAIFSAHPQLNANSYTTSYRINIDDTETGTMRFRLGDEVAQVQSVLLDFQLLPFESTVKSVAGETVTSESAGAHTHTVTIAAHDHTVTIAAHGHTVTVPQHSHTTTVPQHSHTTTIAAHSHTTTIAAHSHTTTIAAHSHTVTIAAHSHTTTIADHDHVIPNHTHQLQLASTSNQGYPNVRYNTDTDQLVRDDSGSSALLETYSSSGQVTSNDGGSATPTSTDQAEAYRSSTDLAEAYRSSTDLAEAYRSSTVLSEAYRGSTVLSDGLRGSTVLSQNVSSSSTYAETTPTSNEQAQTTPTSASAGTHTHTLTPVLSATYGIYREEAGNTYVLADLEYQVNSGGWADLDTATSLGGDWYQLDITASVADSVTSRPTSASNTIDIRKLAAAADDKTVTVDALLSVRNIIQAIAYT